MKQMRGVWSCGSKGHDFTACRSFEVEGVRDRGRNTWDECVKRTWLNLVYIGNGLWIELGGGVVKTVQSWKMDVKGR